MLEQQSPHATPEPTQPLLDGYYLTQPNPDTVAEPATPETAEFEHLLSPTTRDMLGQINSATYPSQLRGLGRQIAGAVAEGKMYADESAEVFHAIKTQRAKLTGKTAVAPVVAPAETWSPSGVLDTMPANDNEPDWRERQLPSGDR